MRNFLGLLLVLLHGAAAAAAQATATVSIRSQEIAECRAGEVSIWSDGRDRPAIAPRLAFVYKPEGSPYWFSTTAVAGMVAKAAAAWSQCGVPAQLLPWSPDIERNPGVVVVQWSEQESGGNFGLANLGRRTLSLGPKAFELLRTRNPAHDAGETLQMTISHEMGHVFGLMAHSRRCVDVMSYYHNGRGDKCHSRDPAYPGKVVEYRHTLPTACDIARCRGANGLR